MLKRLMGVGAVLCLLGTAPVAEATVITTAAGIDGYEWLELTETAGMSRDYVTANLLGTADYEGYRYASRQETEWLLDSYYTGDIHDVDDGWRISTSSFAEGFLSDFGVLYENTYSTQPTMNTPEGVVQYDYRRYANFIYGNEQEVQLGLTPLGLVASSSQSSVTVAGWTSNYYGTDHTHTVNRSYTDFANTSIGSLLVRTAAPVPEPATMLLFGTGLVGLAGRKLRKKKK